MDSLNAVSIVGEPVAPKRLRWRAGWALACLFLTTGWSGCVNTLPVDEAPSRAVVATPPAPVDTVPPGSVNNPAAEATTSEPAQPSSPPQVLAPSTGLAAQPAPDDNPSEVLIERGQASWYGGKFHGRRTASGEIFNKNELTAAHKTLPFGSRVRVRSVRNGREVVVRINDRGPYTRGRVIDLSQAAMKVLGLGSRGVARVELLRE